MEAVPRWCRPADTHHMSVCASAVLHLYDGIDFNNSIEVQFTCGGVLWTSYLDEGAHEPNNLVLHCLDIGLHDTEAALLIEMLQKACELIIYNCMSTLR